MSLVAAAALLAACGGVGSKLKSVLPGDDTSYRKSRNLPPLEVPPDLSSRTIKEGFDVPAVSKTGSARYSDYASGKREPGARRGRSRSGAGRPPARRSRPGADDVVASRRAAPSPGGGSLSARPEVRMERSGGRRWLVVKAGPTQIWPRLQKFWRDNGFALATDDARAGIMETEWTERKPREQPKKGFFRSITSKFRKSERPAATRDSFLLRVDPGREPNSAEVYLSHRRSERKGGGWQPRPPDPEVEAEMLDRMKRALGVGRARAARRLASSSDRSARAHLIDDGKGGTALALRENFARAWQRTGLALDRMGFKIQSRDRARGLYFIRYVESDADSGFMSKLKGWLEEKNAAGDVYVVSLVGGETVTRLLVLNKRGEPDETGTADQIIARLRDELR